MFRYDLNSVLGSLFKLQPLLKDIIVIYMTVEQVDNPN